MKTETLTVRLQPEEKARLKAIGKAEDVPAAQVVRRLIRDFLKQQGKGQPCAPQP